MSKGSNRRPSAVPSSVVDERWARTFGGRRWSKVQPWPEGEPLPAALFSDAEIVERTGPNSGVVFAHKGFGLLTGITEA